jgi:hypothetical protein
MRNPFYFVYQDTKIIMNCDNVSPSKPLTKLFPSGDFRLGVTHRTDINREKCKCIMNKIKNNSF